jgi:hypothetical protein
MGDGVFEHLETEAVVARFGAQEAQRFLSAVACEVGNSQFVEFQTALSVVGLVASNRFDWRTETKLALRENLHAVR